MAPTETPKEMSREQVGAAILDRSEVRGADEGDKVYTHFAIVVDGKVTKTWTSPQALDCFPTRYKEAYPSGDTFFPSGDTFFPSGDTFFPSGDTFFPSGDTFDVVARRVAPKAWKIASPRRGGFVVLTGVSHASEAKHPSAITAVPLRR